MANHLDQEPDHYEKSRSSMNAGQTFCVRYSLQAANMRIMPHAALIMLPNSNVLKPKSVAAGQQSRPKRPKGASPIFGTKGDGPILVDKKIGIVPIFADHSDHATHGIPAAPAINGTVPACPLPVYV
jgi:hypothetical protein